jgi:hypothetical protein
MEPRTVRAFLDELTKIGGTAFSKRQYKELFGPKTTRKNKAFVNPKDNVPASQFQSLTPNDATYNPISSANRVGEGRETPGGPL